jgi:flagellar biosynthetic protein FliO
MMKAKVLFVLVFLCLATAWLAALPVWAAVPTEKVNLPAPAEKLSPAPKVELPSLNLSGKETNPATPVKDESLFKDEAGLKQDSDFGATLTKTFIYLIIICLLAFVVLRFIYQGRKNIGAPFISSNKMIRVIERQMLQPQKYLCLVEVAGRYLLLGVSEQQVTFLTEIEAIRLEEFKNNQEAVPVVPKSWPLTFQSILRNLKPKVKE